MVRILFEDEFGNMLVERKDKAIGVKGERGKYLSKQETKEWIKENKLGNKVRIQKGGTLWVHNKLLT